MLRYAVIFAGVLGLTALLSGCAGSLPANVSVAPIVTGPSSLRITGVVHGGQNPVIGATIQLYTVGTTGLKSASTGLITSPQVSGTGGSFSITGLYNGCNGSTPGTQVYLVASGGDPGGGNNANLSLAAALGSCATLYSNAANISLTINEVTTVAAAYALAPFASDYLHIGATGTNPTGLVNAFSNATLLASNTYGRAGGDNLPAGVTVPVAEINTLANILATCVNSQGTAGSSTACASIFAASGTRDTFNAALAMARSPGASAITALYSLSSPGAPFQPTLSNTSPPNDFSVAVSISNGGLATPYGIAIDGSGDAWVTNESGTTVSEFSPTGAGLNSLAPAGLSGAKGIAISPAGVVWVANTGGNSAFAFTLSGGTLTNTATYPAATFSLSAPSAVAVDSSGNAYFANVTGNSVTGISATGSLIAGSPFIGNGNITAPGGIALDSAGNLYVTGSSGSIIELTHAGVYSATLSDGTLQNTVSVAVDPFNHVLATGTAAGGTTSGALSEFTGGTATAISPVTSGLSSPAGIATDGASIWVANSIPSGGLTQLVYGSATAVSPAAGFGALNTPVGVAVDASGSVWTTNSGSNTVSKFIGLARPPIVSPNLSSYKGIVATRGYVSNVVGGGANATWVMNRSFHIARENISAGSMQVVWGNYLSNFGGDSTYGPGTYKAAIEYPAGTITPCTFSGVATGTVAAGADATTDPCGPCDPRRRDLLGQDAVHQPQWHRRCDHHHHG
jgi:sugar lactone lactonase YvrE